MKISEWRKKLRIKSISNQITIYFSLLITVIILILVTLTVVLFTNHFLTENERLIDQKLGYVTEDISEKINIYRNLASSLKKENAVQSVLAYGNPNSTALQKTLANYESVSGIQSITILDRNFKLVNPSPLAQANQKNLLNFPGISDFFRSPRDEMISPPHDFLINPDDSDYIDAPNVTYIQAVRDEKTYEKIGYVLISINKNKLYLGKVDYCEQLFNQTYVVSSSGDVVARIGEEKKEEEANASKFGKSGALSANFETIAGNTYFKDNVPQYSGWAVVGVVSNRALLQDTFFMLFTIILVGILSIFTVFFISRHISRKITVPIYEMKKSMKKFEEGQMPEKIVLHTHNEFQYLISGFNSMLDDITRLVDAIYHEQEEKKKVEVSALKFQLESLQSQINPHFLYNTLNTVSYLAMRNRPEEIRELVQSLNILLRSTLSNQNDFITIEQEIGFLKAYIVIQKYRYDDNVEIVYDVDDTLLKDRIPKLILQPLVENAFLHGIYPKGDGGKITVSVRGEEKRIRVVVADDGVGMDYSTLSRLNSASKGFNRVGVSNVDERLQLYYGGQAKLHYTSEVHVGTSVSFILPQEKCGTGEENVSCIHC
jgi:two-component system, sensor histidine kinase YesM